MLSVNQALIAVLFAGVVTFFTRVVPFLFFKDRSPSPVIVYLQKYIPPATMVILVAYSMKDTKWMDYPFGFPAVTGLMVTVMLHLWKNNALLSIFGATAVFMFLSRVM